MFNLDFRAIVVFFSITVVIPGQNLQHGASSHHPLPQSMLEPCFTFLKVKNISHYKLGVFFTHHEASHFDAKTIDSHRFISTALKQFCGELQKFKPNTMKNKANMSKNIPPPFTSLSSGQKSLTLNYPSAVRLTRRLQRIKHNQHIRAFRSCMSRCARSWRSAENDWLKPLDQELNTKPANVNRKQLNKPGHEVNAKREVNEDISRGENSTTVTDLEDEVTSILKIMRTPSRYIIFPSKLENQRGGLIAAVFVLITLAMVVVGALMVFLKNKLNRRREENINLREAARGEVQRISVKMAKDGSSSDKLPLANSDVSDGSLRKAAKMAYFKGVKPLKFHSATANRKVIGNGLRPSSKVANKPTKKSHEPKSVSAQIAKQKTFNSSKFSRSFTSSQTFFSASSTSTSGSK